MGSAPNLSLRNAVSGTVSTTPQRFGEWKEEKSENSGCVCLRSCHDDVSAALPHDVTSSSNYRSVDTPFMIIDLLPGHLQRPHLPTRQPHNSDTCHRIQHVKHIRHIFQCRSHHMYTLPAYIVECTVLHYGQTRPSRGQTGVLGDHRDIEKVSVGGDRTRVPSHGWRGRCRMNSQLMQSVLASYVYYIFDNPVMNEDNVRKPVYEVCRWSCRWTYIRVNMEFSMKTRRSHRYTCICVIDNTYLRLCRRMMDLQLVLTAFPPKENRHRTLNPKPPHLTSSPPSTFMTHP